jgi:DNA-binding transcriptional MocR family regulator
MPGSKAYLSIADELQRLIESAVFRRGDRLPSIREIGRSHGVSVPTVHRALAELETRGLVEAKPRAGFYVCLAHAATFRPEALARVPSSSTCLVSVVQQVLDLASRPGVRPLGPSGPSNELFPSMKLRRATTAAARRIGMDEINSFDVGGTGRLREEIARRSAGSGCCLRPEEVVITAGCTEALALCLRATTSQGDAVAIESPAFYGLLLLLQSLGLEVVELPASPVTGLDADEVARVLASRRISAVVVSGNYSHPTGALMPDDAKRRLVDLLAAHDVPLIEDDIFGDLSFSPHRPPPLKAYDRKGLVLLCDSFSKSIAPGYRVGWTSPGRYLGKVMELKLALCPVTSTLPQLGIAEFLKRGGYERHLRSFRKTLGDNVRRTAAVVDRHFPAATRYVMPGGGNFLWLELPAGCDALALFHLAAERGISTAPGAMFSASGRGYSRHLRINCARSWNPPFERALIELGELAGQQLSERVGTPPSPARN